MAIVTAGFDLARNVFAVHGADEVGMPTPVRPVVNASPCLSFPMPGTLMIQPIKSEALATLKQVKYWPPVGRVDNVYGDRNLFCGCVPVADDAQGKNRGRACCPGFFAIDFIATCARFKRAGG